MEDTIIMVFERAKTKEKIDIEVPLDITANDLLNGLNTGLKLGLNLEDSSQCYLCTENPIALIKGNTMLRDYNLHNGTIIRFDK
ncbi:MAG: hypothetical protein J5840_01970 [Lachnospiraceae bacterium]|nr:hypothetical protein [Lachnospiraceae bacterium]